MLTVINFTIMNLKQMITAFIPAFVAFLFGNAQDAGRRNATVFISNVNHNASEKMDFERKLDYSLCLADSSMEAIHLDTLPEDSVLIQANPHFNRRSRLHRYLFGKNYRSEWAAQVKVPIIRVSSFQGGLTPLKKGGGMQTISLRLIDKTGNEWVIRGINKNSEALLPDELKQTFARDFLDDANSAQHPFSALMVPPLAHAAGIAHTKPIIGVIARDTVLGKFNELFAGSLCLIEEREPLGNSDNTDQMLAKVNRDNDNTYHAKAFLRARMLDMLIGDWDRHEDQWRWYNNESGKDKDYIPVPRDRDQAFRKVEGVFPRITSLSWLLPTLQGFHPTIHRPNYSLFKTRFLNSHPKAQFSHGDWMQVADGFVRDMTDSVFEEAIKTLPAPLYALRHNDLITILKQRRAAIPQAMDDYYSFVNNIVDIKLSDKNEQVKVGEGLSKGLNIVVLKMDKSGVASDTIMQKEFLPSITKEIRIYLADGTDNVLIANNHTPIKLRLIGGKGEKSYDIQSVNLPVKVYTNSQGATFSGEMSKFWKHLSSDSLNTAFVPVNLYNVCMPLASAGFNADDGLMIGGGFRYTHQRGFRKTPFTHQQELLVSGSFATGAIKLKYRGQWKEVVGKADLVADLRIYAPGNTLNFFGLGNNSLYDKENQPIKYYRTRFSLYDVQGALQWSPSAHTTVSIGPSFQWYYYNRDDNEGRFINNTDLLHTYDSLTIAQTKLFGGAVISFFKDSRNKKLLTTSGSFIQLNINGLTGLNTYSNSFIQAKGEIALYRSIGTDRITFANRLGGGATLGKNTFYQSLFLGGQNNLLGYRQFRFAGEHMLYNNFEARINVAQVGSYILPGQFGLLGFYDIGKVWASNLDNSSVHQGLGGGLYYAPAKLALLQIVAGHSKEGWYPYFTMGFRF
ncbi:MAG: hypothetical protein K0R59_238 [Sphingobacterium sp.]|jgi:hypothetical protein|nr:hypothetical protein [Sphingobacterium sp.]